MDWLKRTKNTTDGLMSPKPFVIFQKEHIDNVFESMYPMTFPNHVYNRGKADGLDNLY